jgi:hypothetical protein
MSNIIILTHTTYFTQAKIYSSVGGRGMLHLEGETRVRERERADGRRGRGGDHWFKMAGATV